MDVTTIQETHFAYDVDARVVSSDFVVYLVYREKLSRGVFLLVKRSRVQGWICPYRRGDGQLVVADIIEKSGSFRVVEVYASNDW